MFVGKSGVGKHRYARALETHLFKDGHAAYMLDGTNILLGVDSDMIWAQSTRRIGAPYFAEVAHLLLDAGLLVVLTTNAIGLGDVAAVQALIPDFPVLTVEISPESGNVSCADLRSGLQRTHEPSHRSSHFTFIASKNPSSKPTGESRLVLPATARRRFPPPLCLEFNALLMTRRLSVLLVPRPQKGDVFSVTNFTSHFRTSADPQDLLFRGFSM